MHPIYDPRANKRMIGVSVNNDLLNKAKELDIDLNATLEQAIAKALREKQRAKWITENKQAIDSYNHYVESNGTFSEGLRSF